MSDKWLLTQLKQQPGKNGVTMTRLTFQNVYTGEFADMTVDSTYRNFRKKGWDHVVDDECPWGFYSDLKKKTTGKTHTVEGLPILSADSPARIIQRLESYEQAQQMSEIITNDSKPPTPFNRLFGKN